MSNEELQQIVEILKEWVCAEAPGAHMFSALIGAEGSGKSDILQEVKKDFIPSENVFWVSTSMEHVREMEVPANPFWWFWTYMLEEFIKQVPLERLESLAKTKKMDSTEAMKKVRDFYAFYGNVWNYALLDEQASREEDIKALFEAYTVLDVQIIWELKHFERMEELYPKNSEEMRRKAGGNIYNKLFVISPKSIDHFNLNILALSRVEILKLEHSMAGGSSLASAFEEIDLSNA